MKVLITRPRDAVLALHPVTWGAQTMHERQLESSEPSRLSRTLNRCLRSTNAEARGIDSGLLKHDGAVSWRCRSQNSPDTVPAHATVLSLHQRAYLRVSDTFPEVHELYCASQVNPLTAKVCVMPSVSQISYPNDPAVQVLPAGR